MSAMVCGKRSFFEESPTSPQGLVAKRFRRSSISPNRLSPPRTNSNPDSPISLDRLRAIFPELDIKLLERVLNESGDLESAIKSLNDLGVGSAERNFASAAVKTDSASQEINAGVAVTSVVLPAVSNPPTNGAEWVELFVLEMKSASSMDDAKARALRALEVLEKSIRTQAGAEAADNIHTENRMLKEQMEVLLRENGILKRAVAIQHDRQKEADHKNQELHYLKQLVSQYQERLTTLEVNNYALTMHLRQAQQSNSIPGNFHPDVF